MEQTTINSNQNDPTMKMNGKGKKKNLLLLNKTIMNMTISTHK